MPFFLSLVHILFFLIYLPAFQDMGYRGGDLGYQTFLYSNEGEIRKIFMFLVEKLPKESSQTADEPLGKNTMINTFFYQDGSRHSVLPFAYSFAKNGHWVVK